MAKFPNPRYHYEMSPKANYKVDIVTYKCDLCEEKFITLTDLNKHNEIHTKANPKNSQAKQSYETQTVRKSSRVPIPNKKFLGYDCDLCSKSYNRADMLDYHKKKYHQELLSKCDVCKIVFFNKPEFDTHNYAKKPILCKICLKSEDRDKKSKLPTCPKKPKPNVPLPKCACTCCAQSNNKFNRMHKCPVCNKKFFKRINLIRHKQLKHNKANESKTDAMMTMTDSSSTKTDATLTMTDSSSTKTDAMMTMTDSSSTKTDATLTMTDSSSTKTDATLTMTDSSSTKTDATLTMTDSSSTKTDSTSTERATADPEELKVLRSLYTSGQSFDCDICNEICSRPDHLDLYLWRNSGNSEEREPPPKTYPCYVCREPLATLELKKAHEYNHIITMIF
ncbi:zinc finger protein 91-like [Adelges cooleyi]|uniref:zinc finger protein 91-like n=1 Tax=Adelges cooleyi TaxID=133065 RepID=UPI00217F3959|nr:zinc finger protein 91-like [Adelges cooleyi]